VNVFKDKFGDKKEEKHLVKAISIIKKKENEMVEEFNRRFNGIIKEISQDYKPPNKSLLDFCIDAFNRDTSYELRRAKTRDYKACQALAKELEKDKQASWKPEIPSFDRAATKLKDPKGKEVKEFDDDPMQRLMQKLERMELNQPKLIFDHAKEISTLQSRLIQMERAQAQNSQPKNNNNSQSNNTCQRKGQSSEQRPPNPLESANQVNEAPPYCRACDAFHEEATCPTIRRIGDSGMFGTNNQVNVVGKEYHLF